MNYVKSLGFLITRYPSASTMSLPMELRRLNLIANLQTLSNESSVTSPGSKSSHLDFSSSSWYKSAAIAKSEMLTPRSALISRSLQLNPTRVDVINYGLNNIPPLSTELCETIFLCLGHFGAKKCAQVFWGFSKSRFMDMEFFLRNNDNKIA